MNGFSRKGQSCTEFERALVASAIERGSEPSPWLAIVERVGLDMVVAVMDEVGGADIYVPSRAGFFGALLASVRATEIARRLANGDRPVDVARDLGMTRQAVDRARRRAGATTARGDWIRGRVVKGRR